MPEPVTAKKENLKPNPEATIKKSAPKKIFFSYSKNDRKHLEKLLTHLAPLKRNGKIQPWEDHMLLPGEEWDATIKAELEKADIIILIISAEAMNTDYICNVEIKRAMERHKAKEAEVIPIILNHCDWTDAPFSKLNALPIKGKPVFDFPNKAEAWNMITKGIKKILN